MSKEDKIVDLLEDIKRELKKENDSLHNIKNTSTAMWTLLLAIWILVIFSIFL